MALNFPNSPTNGQLYTDTMSGNSWTWDSANTCWKSTSTYIQTITVASSAPGTPAVGQLWWNQDYGRLLVYYNDGTSSQWVDASPSDYTSGLAYNTANAAFLKANNALANTSGVYFNGNLFFPSGSIAIGKTTTSGSSTDKFIDAEGSLSATVQLTKTGAEVGQFFAGSGQIGLWSYGSYPITFGTNGSERMRLDASGQLGVGIVPHSWNTNWKAIEINQAATISARAMSSTPYSQLWLTNNGYRSTDNTSGDTNGLLASWGHYSASIGIGLLTGQDIAFFYAPWTTAGASQTLTETMRVSTTALQLTSLQGIKFQATQSASSDANTLDDYEEGSWTPNINSNNGSGTFTQKVGYYIKIGRKVTAWFVCDAGNSQAAGTTQYVGGLPFSIYNYAGTSCVGQMGTNGPSIRTQQLMTLSANRNVAYVYDGGTQETTTISFATGVLEYLTDN